MQLKEFCLISPVIESADLFKAIETAIPLEMIEQTIGHTKAQEERKRKLPSQLVVCLVIAMRQVVIGLDGNSAEKSSQRIEQTMDKTGAVLENTKQCLD